jgi:hypothetical protein
LGILRSGAPQSALAARCDSILLAYTLNFYEIIDIALRRLEPDFYPIECEAA